MNKHAVAGEMILMIYRVVIIAIIAFFVLGVSAFAYDYYLDVRDIEARILAREVVNCVAPAGVLDLEKFKGKETDILDVCEIENTDRFYINVSFCQLDPSFVKGVICKDVLSHGDSGLLWIKELYEGKKVDSLKKFNPVVYVFKEGEAEYMVLFNSEGKFKTGKLKMEVLISHEF